MATPKRIAVRAAKQTTEILKAVELLAAEIAELKASSLAAVELTAEIDETADRTGEILAAIGNAFGEIVGLKKQVAELTMLVDDSLSNPVQMSTRASRKPKK